MTASATSTVLVPGCRWMARMIDRSAVAASHVPGGGLVVLDAVDDAADVPQADGLAVAIGHDQRPVGGGVVSWPLAWTRGRLVRAVQHARGQVDVALGDGAGHLVDAEALRGQRLRVHLDADGVLLRAVDLHLGHAVDHRDALGHQRLAVFVQGRTSAGSSWSAPGTGSAGRPG